MTTPAIKHDIFLDTLPLLKIWRIRKWSPIMYFSENEFCFYQSSLDRIILDGRFPNIFQPCLPFMQIWYIIFIYALMNRFWILKIAFQFSILQKKKFINQGIKHKVNQCSYIIVWYLIHIGFADQYLISWILIRNDFNKATKRNSNN